MESAPGQLERNAARPKDFVRKSPRSIIIEAKVNDVQVSALLDSGSRADFMSSTLADQLKIKVQPLAKPQPVQLAVSGSRTMINYYVEATLSYGDITETRHFDILNLDAHDIILGTPFLFQHKIALGFNPSHVAIGSASALPLVGNDVAVIASRAAELTAPSLEKLRGELVKYADDICKDALETPLPPLRAVNHSIPLIDESKIYSWRPSKCPDALKPLWREKREAYRRTGRWEFRSGTNAMPMLMLKKTGQEDGALRLRTVIDCRERNANTRKLASPLPDIDAILRNVASHPYRSIIDGKDAYEQIRIVPEHVNRSLFTTPDGTMVSHVMQQGDCNGGATYQALMNHIFAEYIGVFMDVYLDDIVIYSDTAADHLRHVKQVIDVLRRERLFLSKNKLKFLVSRMKILGHIVDDSGIAMDPDKVDNVLAWKTPTNRSLLMGFLGAVGFLAPDCESIRIPMGHLARLTGATFPWRWGATEQRAFEEVKSIVHKWRGHHRTTLDYSKGAPPINLTCDACCSGGSGVISQGHKRETANIVAFWSGKFSTTQQNYPVHEQELLAIVESLKRFRNLLHGARFRVFTDHRALQYIQSQRNLSPRQQRWLEVISEFDFTIEYIPGDTNVLADALSRIYSDDSSNTVRAASEFVTMADNPPSLTALQLFSAPLLTGPAAEAEFISRSTSAENASMPGPSRRPQRTVKPTWKVREAAEQPKPSPRTPRPTHRKPAPANAASKATVSPMVTTPTSPVRTPSAPLEGVSDLHRSSAPSPAPRDASPMPSHTSSDNSHSLPLVSGFSAAYPSLDIPNCLRGRYKDDSFFKIVVDNPKAYKNFEFTDELLYLKSADTLLLCVPNVSVQNRHLHELFISHAHSILAHLSARKTLSYLREHVWWKDMATAVKEFCDSCHTCQTGKSRNHYPYGLLNPLAVPARPWESIGIDFVGPLPESRNRLGAFDMLCVIIDHLTSMVHLVPSLQTYRARDIAEIVFEHVYKLHGIPQVIVSDRDSLFTSQFWERLHALIGTDLRLSSSYHPQSDGATERANRTITQMLRLCISPNQRDWVAKLPAIEFAMNSARSETTGYSPFFLNTGHTPRSFLWKSPTTDEYPAVRTFAKRMKDAVMDAHDAILTARIKQAQTANNRRKPAPFAENDLMYLSTKNLRLPKGKARKLAPKFIGPFMILKDFGNGSFQLDIPRELRRRGIHSTFHSSLLRIHVPNDDSRFPGRQLHQITTLGEDTEWEVDRILSHTGKGPTAVFNVLWKSGDSSWMPLHEIKHTAALQAYFEVLGISSASQLPTPINPSTRKHSDTALTSILFPDDLSPHPRAIKKSVRRRSRNPNSKRHPPTSRSHRLPPLPTRTRSMAPSRTSPAPSQEDGDDNNNPPATPEPPSPRAHTTLGAHLASAHAAAQLGNLSLATPTAPIQASGEDALMRDVFPAARSGTTGTPILPQALRSFISKFICAASVVSRLTSGPAPAAKANPAVPNALAPPAVIIPATGPMAGITNAAVPFANNAPAPQHGHANGADQATATPHHNETPLTAAQERALLFRALINAIPSNNNRRGRGRRGGRGRGTLYSPYGQYDLRRGFSGPGGPPPGFGGSGAGYFGGGNGYYGGNGYGHGYGNGYGHQGGQYPPPGGPFQ